MKKRLLFITMVLCAACMIGCGKSEVPATEQENATTSTSAVSQVVDIATTQYFTDEAVKETDIETILSAGINAPSAMNGQKWHFSAVTDAAVLQQISEGMSGGMGFGGGNPPAGFVPGGTELPEGVEIPEGATPPEGMEIPEGAMPPEGAEMPEKGNMPPQGGNGMTSKAGIADAPLAIIVSCAAGSELDAGLATQNMSVAAQLMGYGTKIISSPTMALNGEKQDEYRELLGIPAEYSAVAVLLVGYEDTSVDETVDGYAAATTRNSFDEMVTYK